MSDLVGNPEDRFSHNEAHFNVSFSGWGKRGLVFLISIIRDVVVSVRRRYFFCVTYFFSMFS